MQLHDKVQPAFASHITTVLNYEINTYDRFMPFITKCLTCIADEM